MHPGSLPRRCSPGLKSCDGCSYPSRHGLFVQISCVHDRLPAIRLGAERRALGSVVERPFGGQYRAACRARVPPVPGRTQDVTGQGRVRHQHPSGQALRRAMVCCTALPAVASARCGGAIGGCRYSTASGAHAGTAAAGPAPGRSRGRGDGADQGSAGTKAAHDGRQARGAGARWSLVCTRPGSILPAPKREHIPSQGYAESSSRTILAPALSARSLPLATSRASGAMPQLVLG